MVPPPTTAAVSPLIALVVGILTFVCLLISLIVLATNRVADVGVEFNDFSAYRNYMLASIVIGGAYTLLQAAFTIYEVSTGNRLGGERLYFCCDKVISYLPATGAAAGFGLTVDLNRNSSDTTNFLNKANAANSLLLLGFLFSAVSSVFSSFSLPKRG